MKDLTVLNWLRAAVLGANDGIVSTAGLVLGLAGATPEKKFIFTAGIAGIIAGALSMAVGEYVSVSNSRDVARNIDSNTGRDIVSFTNPWQAAIASLTSFILGSCIPFFAILLPPTRLQIPTAFISVILALVITGTFTAKAGRTDTFQSTARIVLGGIIAMLITYLAGRLFRIVV